MQQRKDNQGKTLWFLALIELYIYNVDAPVIVN